MSSRRRRSLAHGSQTAPHHAGAGPCPCHRRGRRFAPPLDRACLLAALYHDVARFEQYLRLHTFRDRESCNHGQWGVRILKLRTAPEGRNAAVRKLVLAAVGLHNRFALPAGLPEGMARICHAVRDADKLDILRVMDEHLSGPRPYCPTVVLSLPDDPALHSDKVLDDALAGRWRPMPT